MKGKTSSKHLPPENSNTKRLGGFIGTGRWKLLNIPEDKAVEGCEPRLHIFWKGVRTSASKALPKIGHLSEDTGLRIDFDLTPVEESTHWQELWEKKNVSDF